MPSTFTFQSNIFSESAVDFFAAEKKVSRRQILYFMSIV